MDSTTFLLGVDGGGTRCRARLCDLSGKALGEAADGPANVRFGLEASFSAVREVALDCLAQAGLSRTDLARTVACLALAGVSEPTHRAAALGHDHPFGRCVVTTDAHAACVGAHGGRDGGVVVIGTGAVGWAVLGNENYRVGGWGFPLSDEGSGAWLGCEALRRVLWACDRRIAWTDLLTHLFEQFQRDPHAIVRWMSGAVPRDYGRFAPPVVEYALRDDAVAVEIVRLAAGHVDAIAGRLAAIGAARICLVGGLGPRLAPWLSQETAGRLSPPEEDALGGALRLARAEAEMVASAG